MNLIKIALLSTALSGASLSGLAQDFNQTLPIDVSEPLAEEETLTPEQAFSKGEEALYRGNAFQGKIFFEQAFMMLPNWDKARFGLAHTETQVGNYTRALDLIAPLAQEGHAYKEKAQNLKSALLLRLAREALINENNSDAENYLKQMQTIPLSKEQEAHAIYLGNILHKNLPAQSESKALRVGLLLPLSGPMKSLGEDLLRAAQLALFDHANPNILLYPEDTHGSMEGAREAFNKVTKHGATLVLGPLTADNVRAVQDAAKWKNVPVITFSSDLSVANRDTFLMSFPPEEQARQVAQQAIAQKLKKFTILAPEGAYGDIMSSVFEGEIQRLGGTLVRQARFESADSGMAKALSNLLLLDASKETLKEEKAFLEKEYAALAGAMDDASLTRLKELETIQAEPTIDFDAIFIPARAEEMPLIASQLAFYDVDEAGVHLLGPALWDTPALLSTRGEYLQNALYTAPASNYGTAQAQFKETYGSTASPLGFLAYDALATVTKLYNKGHSTASSIKQALTEPEGFYGKTGAFRFYDNGQIHRMYNLKEVQGRRAATLFTAPTVLPPELPRSLEASDSFFFGLSGRDKYEHQEQTRGLPQWPQTQPAEQQPQEQRKQEKKGWWLW